MGFEHFCTQTYHLTIFSINVLKLSFTKKNIKNLKTHSPAKCIKEYAVSIDRKAPVWGLEPLGDHGLTCNSLHAFICK